MRIRWDQAHESCGGRDLICVRIKPDESSVEHFPSVRLAQFSRRRLTNSQLPQAIKIFNAARLAPTSITLQKCNVIQRDIHLRVRYTSRLTRDQHIVTLLQNIPERFYK